MYVKGNMEQMHFFGKEKGQKNNPAWSFSISMPTVKRKTSYKYLYVLNIFFPPLSWELNLRNPVPLHLVVAMMITMIAQQARESILG